MFTRIVTFLLLLPFWMYTVPVLAEPVKRPPP